MRGGNGTLAESSKRPREENQGNAGESFDRTVKRARDSYEAVKAASADKKYKKGVKLCSLELKQDDLPKSYLKQFLLARSSLYSELGGISHPLAIRDAKEVIVLTPNSATAYLRAAKAFHLAGYKSKAIRALDKAESLTAVKSDLYTYIKSLQAEWNPTLIHKLPDELLVEVMSYLELHELAFCFRTCRRWKSVTSTNPGLWCGSHIVLKGKAQRIAANWTKILKLTNGGKVKSLSLRLNEKDSKLSSKENTLFHSWVLDSLRQTFPSDTLYAFEYIGACKAIDDQIWALVKSCKRLRSLRWTSYFGFGPNDNKSDRPFRRRVYDHHIKGSPLANCQLEEFHFENYEPTFFDYSYVDLLGQAKRLSLGTYLSCRRLSEILFTKESALEELQYTVSLSRNIPIYDDESEELPKVNLPYNHRLNNLITIKTIVPERNHAIPEFWNLKLPKVTNAVIDCSTVHLNSFSSSKNLVSLEYNFQDDDPDNSFESVGLKLSNCETLILSFTFNRHLDEFWKGAQHVDPNQRIVPRLKNLSIDGLCTLTGTDLVKFIRSRIQFETPLENLEITNCEKVDYESVSLLKKMVPSFVCRAVSQTKKKHFKEI